ncbi:hypothetical protein TSH100_00660 [Azospirillum sp. TSH100]|uniref:hypothetical protein n=1 Tax=Azospirillum sp. TSH100 TaxID=652764 RepID=UPI000D610AD6|nr:hypothetical protein [Azospirillum sp. TSH100]PWC91430.1 hypothetical protein TSH100_00660 [Azospirillum sp. TSH100]QCG89145.1 hypothetical protein E6C72_15130 [Azospirillum sp. TSH100]
MTEPLTLPRRDAPGALSPDWRRLCDARAALGTIPGPLSTTARWCSANGVEPSAVDEGVLNAVADHLTTAGTWTDRKEAYRQVRAYWNAAVKKVPGWPQAIVQAPPQPPRPQVAAAVRPTARTLEDLRQVVASSALVADSDRPALVSAITSTARWLGRPPGELPASLRSLDPQLKALANQHAALGVSRKTVKNVKSLLRKALDLVAPRPALPPVSDPNALTPEWRALWAAWRTTVPRAYGPLSFLMRHCSEVGIAPDAVDAAVAAAVADRMMACGCRGDLTVVIRQVRGYWNQAVETVPGWPSRHLTLGLVDKGPVSLPLTAFPPAFQRSLEDLRTVARTGYQPGVTGLRARAEARKSRAIKGDDRRKKDDGGRKRLRAASVEGMCDFLRRFASWAVHHGHRKLEELSAVSDVVNEQVFVAWYDAYRDKHVPAGEEDMPRKPAKTLHNACGFLAMAAIRLPLKDAPVVADLLPMLDCAREEHETYGELTPENQRKLAQFAIPENLRALHEMPIRVMEYLESERQSRTAAGETPVTLRMALTAAAAMGVLLLNSLPVRVLTLSGTRLDNVQWPLSRHADGAVAYEARQTKGKIPARAVLKSWKILLLSIYRTHYRPLLGDVGNSFLFPRHGKDKPMRAAPFSGLISRVVARETGLAMNPHLWRHLATKLLLDEDPRYRDTVSRLLGHHGAGRHEYGGVSQDQAAAALETAVDRIRAHTPGRARRTAKAAWRPS